MQGLGCAPGTSRFLPGFGAEQESTAPAGRRGGRRTQSTRTRMPVMRGLLAPQNTFLDTIATRFDGTLHMKFHCVVHHGDCRSPQGSAELSRPRQVSLTSLL
ncbi:potassium voltage-gated channel subfamily H member 8 [Labeo rohita]|uniref:Potassium voltage-gated channel subfamily H member 8 n=1 Tax=Labeo rohita TaxID=84645 RepID=A0A498N3R6_LABRO|nr:potassium voltage-gated channel subfamily H member 8 [Labeo rohita]